jgi:hypothetical protein
LDNPAIETQTVAKARVRNMKFSGYIQRHWPRPLERSMETDKVFRINRDGGQGQGKEHRY